MSRPRVRQMGRDTVTLREVTADNWEAVVELELDETQQDLVASNAYSLAESKFDPAARPRAVYAGRQLVGFLMYEILSARASRQASIYRFMIDRRRQHKGFGRAALACALDEIRAEQVRKVSIRYMAENPVAKEFYASFGFVEVGRDEDDEVIAELRL